MRAIILDAHYSVASCMLVAAIVFEILIHSNQHRARAVIGTSTLNIYMYSGRHGTSMFWGATVDMHLLEAGYSVWDYSTWDQEW